MDTSNLRQELYRAPEAARILGIGRTTVYRLMDRGDLHSVRIGTARRIPRSAIEAYLNSLTD